MSFSFNSFKEKSPTFWISEIRLLTKLSDKKDDEIRHIPLAQGLNIIWSEPGASNGPKEQRGRGHAAGKTSFCRAIRYVLGEEQYGSKFVEEKIAKSKPLNNALIYASVYIGETQWSVFRPLNKRHWQKQEFAVKGADFVQALAAASEQRLPFTQFTETLQDALLHNFKVKHYDTAQSDPITWLDVLMPLARDQEAHLSSLHNWRDSSATQTPSKFTPPTRAFLIRALLSIADSEETTQLQIRAFQGSLVTRAELIIASYRQVLEDEVYQLEAAFNTKFELPKLDEAKSEGDSLFLSSVRRKALEAKNRNELEINAKISELEIEKAREMLQLKKVEIGRLEGRLQEPFELLNTRERFLKALRSSKPTEAQKEQDLCDRLFINASKGGRACQVPIEEAKEYCHHYWKCEIKNRLAEEPETATEDFVLQQIRITELEIANLKKELVPGQNEINRLNSEVTQLQKMLEAGGAEEKILRKELENLGTKYHHNIQSAQTITSAITRQEDAKLAIIEANKQIKLCEETLSTLRKKFTKEQKKLSDLFNFIVSEIVSDDLTGELKFSKIEINAALTRNGELESAAYRALRCIAYDFTTLSARLANMGNHPGFLLHDSPRESDLEYSLYQQIFTFAAHLNEAAPNSFQYIVTTTEAPPKELINSHVKLNLDGSTEQGRLYRQNL